MYLIAGSSGNTGKVVAESLLARGKKVRVLVRDKGKGEAWAKRGAEVAVGRLDDAGGLSGALQGAEGAYLLIPPDPQTKDFMARGRAMLNVYFEALSNSNVQHVAFLSSIGAQHVAGTGPIKILHQAEDTLGALTRQRVSFIRAAYFMENLLGFLTPAREQGVVPVFGGGENYPFCMVASRDIGEVAAQQLMEPPTASQVIELSGPASYSFADVARVFGQALGRTVVAKAMPIDAVVPTMMQAGMSEDVAQQYREMIEGMGQGLLAFGGGKARAVRGNTSLEAFVRGAIAG
jgi:uncharacterized protein YbjT (DUF2867 family)